MKALLASLTLLAASTALADEFQPVRTLGVEGALLPASYCRLDAPHSFNEIAADGFWTPTAKDLETPETYLRPHLISWHKDPLQIEPTAKDSPLRPRALRMQLGEIIARYMKYRRQYIGLIIRGHRYIYLNSFPADKSNSYMQRLLGASDGGSQYWQVLYSVDDAIFSELQINGHG